MRQLRDIARDRYRACDIDRGVYNLYSEVSWLERFVQKIVVFLYIATNFQARLDKGVFRGGTLLRKRDADVIDTPYHPNDVSKRDL